MRPEPLPVSNPSRLEADVLINSDSKTSLRVSMLPVINKLKDAVPFTGRLAEASFLEPVIRVNDDGLYAEEFTVFALSTYPDLTRENIKPILGVKLHGDNEVQHTSLYPDLYLGTGFSAGTMAVTPFGEIIAGSHVEHSGANWYQKEKLGLIYNPNVETRIILSGEIYQTSHLDYRGYQNALHASFSQKIADRLWLSLEGEHYSGGEQGQNYTISTGLSFRFW